MQEKKEVISNIPFETLISFHKQEGQEELAYLTILFTIVIGIIGYLGSAQKIERSARVLILLFYIGLHFAMVTSFLDSMKMHSALHQEIKVHVVSNPKIFYNKTKSPLYIELSSLEKHDTTLMSIAGYSLLIFVVLCILSIGNNSIIKILRINRKQD